jgi:3,4-dihydroxy 2-butanone 4-phosphate synthase / GTP cyclohydrolase II
MQLTRSDIGISAERALAAIAAADCGVFVALGDAADPEDWLARLRQDGRPPSAAADVWRTSGLGAQILAGLGVHRLRVIGTQRRYLGLSGFGLEVVDYTAP